MLQALSYVLTTNLHHGKVYIVIHDLWDFQKNIPSGYIIADTVT